MDFSNSGGIKLKEFRCEKVLVKHKCKYCDFATDLRIILYDHIRRLHKTSPDYSKPDLQTKPYTCSNCDFMSYSILVWRIHKSKCTYISEDESKSAMTSWKFTQSGSLKQQITGCKYFDNKSYGKYFESNHSSYKAVANDTFEKHIFVRQTDSEKMKWFECDQCKHKTKRRADLQRHINIRHHRENLVLYKCNKCSFKTFYKYKLKCHMGIRHGDPKNLKWHECDRCYYKTASKSTLQRHIRIKHFRENMVEFKCSLCSFKTVYNRNLKNHINVIHAREKGLECSKCFFKTAYKKSLERHMVSRHADFKEIRRFECSQCKYKTKQERFLQYHIAREHAPENMIYYECHHCSYKTTFKRDLKRHIISRHTLPENINWFKCDQCKYKAKLKSNLQAHIKKKHVREDLVQP